MSSNIVPLRGGSIPENQADRLMSTARAQMLVALSRLGAFDESVSVEGVGAHLAAIDGAGEFNAYEARDQVGRAAEILRAALRLEVADARAVEAGA